jgi:hypothetical protein
MSRFEKADSFTVGLYEGTPYAGTSYFPADHPMKRTTPPEFPASGSSYPAGSPQHQVVP